MPKLNGIELIKSVQAFNPHMKTIVTSGYIADTSRFSELQQFVHIIKKPYKNIDSVREFLLLFLQNAALVNVIEENEEERTYTWEL